MGTTKLLLLDSLLQESSGVRPQDDQGNQLLWKAAQQDAHNLQEMWNGGFPHPEEDLRILRLPCSQEEEDYWNWSHEVPFHRSQEVPQRLPRDDPGPEPEEAGISASLVTTTCPLLQ